MKVHFFKSPVHLVKLEMLELAEEIEQLLSEKGYSYDTVVVTNLDYQGTVEY
jgi:hypothetical protein